MPYAIMRFQKKTSGKLSACECHNERKKSAYKSNPNIDPERSQYNYHLVEAPKYTYGRAIKERLNVVNCRKRKNSVLLIETLITASPELMNELPEEEQREFFARAVEFFQKKIGKENVVSAVVHMDEKTPHMHLSFIPLTRDGRLSAKEIIGNQKHLSEWQTEFHEYMSERWTELERGRSAMETGRKHIPVWLYKQSQHLDKEIDEILKEIASINLMNVSKKKEVLVEKIMDILPQQERFESEINKVSGHIQLLEEKLVGKSKDLSYWHTKANEKDVIADKKIQEQGDEIFQLKRTLRRYEQMFNKLPDDIKDEIRRKRAEKDQER